MKQLTEKDKSANYLGDGAYCIDEGYHLKIFTSDGIHITNEIYLEDVVAKTLKRHLDNFINS